MRMQVVDGFNELVADVAVATCEHGVPGIEPAVGTQILLRIERCGHRCLPATVSCDRALGRIRPPPTREPAGLAAAARAPPRRRSRSPRRGTRSAGGTPFEPGAGRPSLGPNSGAGCG